MKNTFREYHQYTAEEFKELWGNCLFVFDTNALLNMYRYSRKTVNVYFEVLTDLKNRNQLWIPYQVGYEFYENRINVITEYEESYDEISSLLENAKNEIETKYKDHPFLDLKDINRKVKEGLSSAEATVKDAKIKHPKWLENDEVLEKLNELFEKSVGSDYDNERMCEIIKEGAERYSKKIPPGFKDNKKPDNKKYGDLVLWYQIIDKAIESKKPIIFVSGDVKEDWWLEKNGKRLMPLPQLKKEMYEKANVDFHIYTADRFLKLSESEKTKIDEKTISEVRKIRQLEEKREMLRRRELLKKEREYSSRVPEKYVIEYSHLLENLKILIFEDCHSEMNMRFKDDLENLFFKSNKLLGKLTHEYLDRDLIQRFLMYNQDISYFIQDIVQSGGISSRVHDRLIGYINRLENMNHKLERYM